MGLSMSVYKDKYGKEEIDTFKPGREKHRPLIEMSTESYNDIMENCRYKKINELGNCTTSMCFCNEETMYKIESKTGIQEIDDLIDSQGYAWIDFSY